VAIGYHSTHSCGPSCLSRRDADAIPGRPDTRSSLSSSLSCLRDAAGQLARRPAMPRQPQMASRWHGRHGTAAGSHESPPKQDPSSMKILLLLSAQPTPDAMLDSHP
jgi:hypothetical protein